GSANALISFRFTGVNEYSYNDSFSSGGAAATRRSPSFERYDAMRSSWMIGYCLRTSAAASRPSSTSCFGVYLFFGSFTTVCAARPAIDTPATTMSTAARADAVWVAMTALLRIFAGSRRRRSFERAGEQASHVRAA